MCLLLIKKELHRLYILEIQTYSPKNGCLNWKLIIVRAKAKASGHGSMLYRCSWRPSQLASWDRTNSRISWLQWHQCRMIIQKSCHQWNFSFLKFIKVWSPFLWSSSMTLIGSTNDSFSKSLNSIAYLSGP